MSVEYLLIQGVQVPHNVVRMRGDGGCLFYSLSYIVYGTDTLANEVRGQIVEYVSNNWDRFQVMSADRSGDNYTSTDEYIQNMSRPETYGTTCELIAAGEIFPFQFQVFRNAVLMAEFGEALEGCGKIKFSGDLFN